MVAWAALPPMSNGVAASRRRRGGSATIIFSESAGGERDHRGGGGGGGGVGGGRGRLAHSSSMISRSATQKRAVCQPAAVTKFRNFDDVEIRDVNQPKSIFARVDFKFPVSASGNLQRFILLDMTGSKIEAVARGTVVS
ncbi:hypothetical protein EJB05_11226 [Eragrostis curvula]|uniref:Uncharacterized protein n=1 Tax=Eragrostis curvula TaxID=38414 RepID=A0A5J9VNY9_9POAL|nr:hypothetical protein EJB05_11226 [Eragrostis curvula]